MDVTLYYINKIEFKAGDIYKEDGYIVLIVGIVGLILSVIVYKTSNSDEPPKYLWVFAVIAFFNSIFWI